MDDYERAAEAMKQKKHLEELEEIRKTAAQNREIESKNDMMREGYVSRGSAKLAAEQAQREKEQRIEKKERELSGLRESMSSATFRKLVEMYKKDSSFSRLSRKIKGEAPNWKKIEGYSAEALDYLEAVAKGDTYSQRKDVKRNRDTLKTMNKASSMNTSSLSNESLQSRYFAQFLKKLMMSEPALLREIEAEKRKREADIALYGKDMSR